MKQTVLNAFWYGLLPALAILFAVIGSLAWKRNH